ncbi:MAG: response regulator [Candidatus Sericytochromatia bacterium]
MNKEILYIDDNQNDIELTLEAIKNCCGLKNQIKTFNSVKKAIDYLYSLLKDIDKVNNLPLFILLDIKMPDLNGIEVLKIIKENSFLKKIPVIMLTSSNMNSDISTCYELGANAYILKKTDFLDFMDIIQKTVNFWSNINQTI